MRLKLSVGLVAALAVPVLLAQALAQSPSADQPARVTRPARSAGARTTIVSEDLAPQGFGVADPALISASPSSFQTQSYTASRNDSFFFAPGRTPEEARLAHESEGLAKKLGEVKSDPDRAKIKEELSQVLAKQFDLRQKRHLDEIKALEDKVKKLKELVDKRQENRREIVSKRLEQILSDAEGLGW